LTGGSMDLSKTLLGIPNCFSSKSDAVTAIVSNDRSKTFLSCQPVLVSSDIIKIRGGSTNKEKEEIGGISLVEQMDRKYTNNVSVIQYFPSSKIYATRKEIIINENDLILTDSRGVIEDRKTKRVDYFDTSKILDILDFVINENALTILIDSKNAACRFIDDVCIFTKKFKNFSYLGNQNDKKNYPAFDEDELVSFVSFYDLKYSIPVFSTKRAKGMGVHFGMYWDKSTREYNKPYIFGEFYFVVNMFPENILIVDGSRIKDNSFVPSEIRDRYTRILKESELKVNQSKKSTNIEEKKIGDGSNKKDTYMWVSSEQPIYYTYNYSTTTSSTSGSTSSTSS
jgi:hypothetical protein